MFQAKVYFRVRQTGLADRWGLGWERRESRMIPRFWHERFSRKELLFIEMEEVYGQSMFREKSDSSGGQEIFHLTVVVLLR